MTAREIERIVVVGAGLMGHGIAQELAVAGYAVALHDASPDVLERAPLQIRENLEALVAMGRLDTGQVEATLARIRCTAQLEEVLAEADLVIEAVTEDLGLKQEIFAQLDRLCPLRTILASNTSSYLPSMLAERTGRPDKVLVTHYFNPPYLVPLVEIVRGEATSDETVAAVSEILTKVGKSPAVIEKEVPGFVGNRLQAALLREALAIVEQGIARVEDVDIVIKHGMGRRWAVAGVFEVFDLAGLDTVLAAMEQIMPDLDTSREPSAILRDRVARGELGAKTGKGFYEWTPSTAAALRQRIRQALVTLSEPI